MHARSWDTPHPPVLAVPDRFLPTRLLLEDAWLDATGAWRPLADESTAGLWSILGYLRWYAPLLMAQDPAGAQSADADGYLASRPLVAAVDKELARRGAIARGEALATLRAAGPAPWELAGDPPSARGSGRRGRR